MYRFLFYCYYYFFLQIPIMPYSRKPNYFMQECLRGTNIEQQSNVKEIQHLRNTSRFLLFSKNNNLHPLERKEEPIHFQEVIHVYTKKDTRSCIFLILNTHDLITNVKPQISQSHAFSVFYSFSYV